MTRRLARSRRTRRRDTAPVVPTAAAGALVIAVLAVLMWQALRVYNGVPGRAYATYYVSTPEVGNLLSHDQVRIAGARVGQVLDRDIDENGKPRIELQIEPGTELPSDTKVAVRGAGLLGARYVELIPGRSATPLDEGAEIVGDEGSFTYGVPEALDTFDKETRGALADTLGGLGQGFLGHGEKLNRGISAIATRDHLFGEFAREVLRRDGAAGRLVPALSAAASPLDANRKELVDTFSIGGDAVQPFIDKTSETRAALDEAGPAFAAVKPGLQAGTGLLTSLQGAAREATRVLPDAPAGFRATTALLDESRAPLTRVRPVLDQAEDAVPEALKLTAAVRPVLGPLDDLLDEASPTLRQVARYSCDVKNFAATMRSMTGYTQPGTGPLGSAQAFRLQLVAPVSVDAFGVKDRAPRNKRDQVVAPCTFLAKPYPQFNGGTGR